MRLTKLLPFLLVPQIAWGVISNTPDQTHGETVGGGSSTLVINSGDGWASPTSGDLLVCVVSVRENTTDDIQISITGAGTWNEPQSNEGTAAGAAKGSVFWKESDGTETTITVDFGTSAHNGSSAVCAEYPVTDLDLSSIDASGENTSNVSGSATTQSTGSATNTVADALVIGGLMAKRTDQWNTTTTISGYTIQDSGGSGSNGYAVLASKVVSSAADQAGTFSTTDTGGPSYGAIMIFGAAGISLTPDDATPDYDQSVVFTLGGALAGGNPTALEFANGNSISCDSATSTTCTIQFALVDFTASADLANTEWTVSQTVNLTDGTNDSSTATITFNNPDNGTDEHYNVSTCADPGCNDDSLYEDAQFLSTYPSFASGDSVYIKVGAGACDVSAAGVFECDTLPADGDIAIWDDSGSVWFGQSTFSIPDPAVEGCGVSITLTPAVRPMAYSPVKTPACN